MYIKLLLFTSLSCPSFFGYNSSCCSLSLSPVAHMSRHHSELFEVITSPSGGSQLAFHIACATPKEHYARTTQKHDAGTSSTPAGAAANSAGLHSSTATAEPPCATGLRVYEGAQVLAAFLVRFGRALLPCTTEGCKGETSTLPCLSLTAQHTAAAESTSPHSEIARAGSASPPRTRCVVELGCGCALVGFTASCVYGAETVIVMTDASTDCLDLVRATGGASGLSVMDGTAFSREDRSHPVDAEVAGVEPSAGSLCKGNKTSSYQPAPHTFRRKLPPRMTLPLAWSPQGVQQLLCCVSGPTDAASRGVDLVLGSDLMYYRVDTQELLRTARQLLQGASSGTSVGGGDRRDCVAASCATSNTNTTAAEGEVEETQRSSFIVFSHFMRIPDGRRKLAAEARQLGMGVVHVPLTSFLNASVVQSRGWGGMEVVLLFIRGACCERGCSRDVGCEAHVTAPVHSAKALKEVEEADVAEARRRLLRVTHTTTPGGALEVACRCVQQAVQLADQIAPYTGEGCSQAALTDGMAAQNDEEAAALLHLFA